MFSSGMRTNFFASPGLHSGPAGGAAGDLTVAGLVGDEDAGIDVVDKLHLGTELCSIGNFM